MSLAILVPMVIAGVTLIVALIHWSGLSTRAEIASASVARERFLLDYPKAGIFRVDLTADGRAAFLALGDGTTGLVETFGDRMVTEMLGRGNVAFAYAEGPRLIVQGKDYTWKGGSYRLSGDEIAARIARSLQAAVSGESGKPVEEAT
jgi:hypothetical protein